jgi:hypothetical protein
MPSRVLRTYMDDDHCGGVGEPLVPACAIAHYNYYYYIKSARRICAGECATPLSAAHLICSERLCQSDLHAHHILQIFCNMCLQASNTFLRECHNNYYCICSQQC